LDKAWICVLICPTSNAIDIQRCGDIWVPWPIEGREVIRIRDQIWVWTFPTQWSSGAHRVVVAVRDVKVIVVDKVIFMSSETVSVLCISDVVWLKILLTFDISRWEIWEIVG
jgi:hypothetical protein